MSRIPLIDDLLQDQVDKFGKEYVVIVKKETGDNRGSKAIKLKTIRAISQPTSTKERMRLPEGDRVKESRFYGIPGPETVAVGNVIEETSERRFEVKEIQRWDTTTKALGVRVT